ARAAGRGVRRDDALPRRDVEAAELVPEGRRQLPQQERVAAAERLQVGAVGESELDLHEQLAGPRLWIRHFFHPQVAPAVVARRPHGVKTTFSALRLVKSSSPSAKRASGRTTGSGTSSSGKSAAASRIDAGVAEREPATVSSRR